MQLCDKNQFLTGRRNSTKKKKNVEKLNVVLWKIRHSIKLPNAAVSSRRGTILFFIIAHCTLDIIQYVCVQGAYIITAIFLLTFLPK